jgi:hypothetical protein
MAYVKLSTERWYAPKNLLPICFFGTLTIIGYTSVVLTIYMLVKQETTIGHRPDLIDITPDKN